jgi:hypothetical protein
VILSLNPLSSLKSLGESKFGAKGRGKESLECLGVLLDEVRLQLNEWVMVRRDERVIYTLRQNPTIQICIGSSDTDCQDFWCL